MNNHQQSELTNQPSKKFYFLEYFYLLLKSVVHSSNLDRAFDQFVELKQEHRLGDSRYKKLTVDTDVSNHARVKFRYTFQSVLREAEEYDLVKLKDSQIDLTSQGKEAIRIYEEESLIKFNQFLLSFMEGKYEAYRYLVEACYTANRQKSGLLIFPIYSPNRLDIKRDSLKKSGDLQNYFQILKDRLVRDIQKYLGEEKNLDEKNTTLINSLTEARLLPRNAKDVFDPKKYNVILKRGRDFWLKYFLQDLYDYKSSLTTFDTWAYRAKQVGVLHITEFYPDPNFNGRVVYPLSVIISNKRNQNFHELYTYPDQKKLYIHQPLWENPDNPEEFVRVLHQAYLEIRMVARSYFVNLLSVRERVCYTLKIPEYVFDLFLDHTYQQQQDLSIKIKISLEVDKLPDETKVMYLRREQVMVAGKYRNIIAIDII